jgi:citrate synthase
MGAVCRPRDDELNVSTDTTSIRITFTDFKPHTRSAFLHATSSLTDPISSLSAAVVCAYGPLHAGAITCAYADFERIGSPDNVPELISAVKAKKQRLFGYGHRIYKAVDPRAKWIQAMMEEHRDLVYQNPKLQIAMEIDRVASTDEWFTSRNVRVNADLYGCFLYTAMGFPTDIVVAMVSLSRAGGLLAHWREAMQESPNIWRPQQIYTGPMASAAVRSSGAAGKSATANTAEVERGRASV